MISKYLLVAGVAVASLFMIDSDAQPKNPNYDEAKAGEYTLPDPLKFENGQPVKSAKQWTKRRAEILHLFEENVYGRAPKPLEMTFEKKSVSKDALGGLATRREVTIHLMKKDSVLRAAGPALNLLIYVPNAAQKPVPAFLGLNFEGNQAVANDPAITITTNWVPNSKERGITD